MIKKLVCSNIIKDKFHGRETFTLVLKLLQDEIIEDEFLYHNFSSMAEVNQFFKHYNIECKQPLRII